MKSTMQTTPLLISRLMLNGTRLHADQEVVTWTADGPRRLSYGAVGTKCAQLAHALRGLGISGDQRVATFMWNNAEHLVAYLAVPSMGAVLHALNIRLFPEQIIYVTNHAENQVAIVDNTLAKAFSQLLPHLHTLRHILLNGPVDEETMSALRGVAHIESVHDLAELLAAQPESFEWPDDLDEDGASSMCYTSGTTGNPKGVVYSHRSNYLHTMQVGLGVDFRQGDRLLAVVPMFHANAWGLPYAAMLLGASLVMPDRFLQAEPLAAMIESEKVTGGGGVPTIWADLLRHLDEHPTDTSSVRSILVGGSAAPPALIRAFQERHDISVVHAWGMTEMSPLGSTAIAPADAEGEDYWFYRQTQGRLPAGVEGRLIGPDGEEQPWDGSSVGELEVRGPWITASYHDNGSNTEAERADAAARFHDGWLRTGDVGSLTRDGFLRLTDRAKDVIKSGGEWISSIEIENIAAGHPKALIAAVIGVAHPKWDERPLLLVQLKPGESATRDEFLRHLEGKIAKWWTPDDVLFVDSIPLGATGKIDKKVIRAAYVDYRLPTAQAAE